MLVACDVVGHPLTYLRPVSPLLERMAASVIGAQFLVGQPCDASRKVTAMISGIGQIDIS
jgi:hypothetical protein